jgi:hypothetical protein
VCMCKTDYRFSTPSTKKGEPRHAPWLRICGAIAVASECLFGLTHHGSASPVPAGDAAAERRESKYNPS